MGNGCARCFRKESRGGEAYTAVPGNSNAHNTSAHKSRNNEAYEQVSRFDIARNYANQNASFVQVGDGTNLPDAVVNDGEFQLTHSISQVQHISDRDPQALSAPVPSDNPRCKTLFLNKARRELNRAFRNKRAFREQSSYSIVSSGAVSQASVASTLHRRASTSSVYANDSSVSQPNLKIAIKTVSLAVYFHIKNRVMQAPAAAGGDRQASAGRSLPIFDEREHPMNREPVPSDYATREPDHKVIYRFVRNLFSSAQLTAECAIVTLVYLERLLTYAELEIAPANWKRILLGSILLASKVWDDQAVWNVDYCQILKDLLVDDVNELERQFLEAIEFNIDVPSNVYAKYYFDLRVLADAYELSGSYAPLSKERAAKLEAAGHVGTHSHTPLKECAKDILHFATLKRTRSFDSLFIKLPIDYFIIS